LVADGGADFTVTVGAGGVAYAGCGKDEDVIYAIVNPIFGNTAIGCNSTDSYRCAGPVLL
jgi:hypothetical protein